MNQKKLSILYFLLFLLGLLFPNKIKGQSDLLKTDTVEVFGVEEETFVVDTGILNIIEKYTTNSISSLLESAIKDSMFTVRGLKIIFDRQGLVPDSIAKIFLELEEELEARRRLLVITQIAEAILVIEEGIKIKRTEKKLLKESEEIALIDKEIATLTARLQNLGKDYGIAVTGIDTSGFFQIKLEVRPLEDELRDVITPIIRSFKGLMGGTQRIAKINDEITYYESHIVQIKEGIAKAKQVYNTLTDSIEKERSHEILEFWEEQEKEFVTKLNVTRHRLLDEELKGEKGPSGFSSFIRGTGKNISLVLLIVFVISLLSRLLQRLINRMSPLHKSQKHIFGANLIDLGVRIFTSITILGAVMYVLLLLNDWILLGFLFILIIGIIWSAKDNVVTYGKELQLLLNAGSIRQNERIVYKGVPYNVEKIGLFGYLNNPLLTGGRIRLPMKELLGMNSRPQGENEYLFPTLKGDWIKIGGSLRQIQDQTPEYVTIISKSGSPRIFSTTSFLGQNFINLSRSRFDAAFILNIESKHYNSLLNGGIELIKSRIKEFVDANAYEKGDQISAPYVALWDITSSSLKVLVHLTVPPELASSFKGINALIKRATAEVAEEQGWWSPFSIKDIIKDK
jgi:hypothetical protein